MKRDGAVRKDSSEMTDEELCARIGIPTDCPDEIVDALLIGKLERYLAAGREEAAHAPARSLLDRLLRARAVNEQIVAGIEAVKAAALEQSNWSPERKEEARLESLHPGDIASVRVTR